ncbi:hypothetical protein Ae201684P_015401 [Aphanomyces euteiches]|nr:hypothetical protein Ae201684P_015401 [Aphanomyces euteiches]
MIRKNPVHLSYSAKKELLEAWKEAQKEEGMTKVLFSRRHKTSLSTFTKWCAQAESIEQVEDDDRKHLSNKRKKVRGAYTKKRPTDERKGLLYDWLQTAPKSINQADLRGEARRLWPEFCDEDYPLCKTSGSFRKFCLRFSERYCPSSTAADVDKDDANSACNRQNSDTKEQTIDIAVSEDDDQAHSSVHDTVIQPLKSSVEASGCDEPGVCAACGHRLTLRSAARADDAMEKQPAKCPPSTHISIEDKNNIVESAWTNNDQSQFLCDWQDSDLERQVLDVFATGKDERVQSSVDKLKTTPLKRHACNQSGGGDSVCDLHCCAVQISDPSVVQAVPSTMKAANNLNNLDNEHIKNKSVCQQEVVEIIDSPQEKRTNSSPTISESSADEGDYSTAAPGKNGTFWK